MSALSFLRFPRRHAAQHHGPRTYTGSNGNTVTVVPKAAVRLPADLGDGFAEAIGGPPWEGASATGQPEPPPGPAGPAWWHHDTVTDFPAVHDRPYVPEPEPVYVPDLEEDVDDLTIFRDVIRRELIRRDHGGRRDGRPWQARYAAAYDGLWLDCDELIEAEPDFLLGELFAGSSRTMAAADAGPSA